MWVVPALPGCQNSGGNAVGTHGERQRGGGALLRDSSRRGHIRAVGSLNLVVRPGRLSLPVAGVLLLVSIIPAWVSASTVGVRLDDWWEYGTSGNFFSNHPESPDPREMMETVPAFYRVAVVGVSDTAVVLEMTAGFNNGTTVKGRAAGDLATGAGNFTILDLCTATFLLPAGLGKEDWPWGTMVPQDPGAHQLGGYPPIPPTHINDTVSRTYAGATREVNVISGTQPEGWGPGWYRAETTMIIVFDKMTGIVCEVFLNVTSTQGDWVTTMSNTMELAATNAWRGAGIAEIGGIPGAIGPLSVIVLGQRFAKRRRSPLDVTIRVSGPLRVGVRVSAESIGTLMEQVSW